VAQAVAGSHALVFVSTSDAFSPMSGLLRLPGTGLRHHCRRHLRFDRAQWRSVAALAAADGAWDARCLYGLAEGMSCISAGRGATLDLSGKHGRFWARTSEWKGMGQPVTDRSHRGCSWRRTFRRESSRAKLRRQLRSGRSRTDSMEENLLEVHTPNGSEGGNSQRHVHPSEVLGGYAQSLA